MNNWIGKYIIARCTNAGVHAGILIARNGNECELKESRRLWRWRVKDNRGISLSDVARYGLDERDTRLSAPVPIILTEVCEYIECSMEVMQNIAGFPTYEP